MPLPIFLSACARQVLYAGICAFAVDIAHNIMQAQSPLSRTLARALTFLLFRCCAPTLWSSKVSQICNSFHDYFPLLAQVVIGNMPLSAQEFGQVYQAWGDFGDAQGIVGLAFSEQLSDSSTTPILDAMLKSGSIKTAEFAVYMSTVDSDVNAAYTSPFGSEISFGYKKDHLHTAPFTNHTLINKLDYWAIRMLEFRVDGEPIVDCRLLPLGYCKLVVGMT